MLNIYKLIYKGFILLIFISLIFAGCSGGGKSSSDSPVLENDPPVIISVSPENNEENVAIDTAITVIFDRDMDSDSIYSDTFIVRTSDSGPEDQIEGTITYIDKTAQFIPLFPLEYSQGYIITLSAEITDLDDNHFSEEPTWGFTTIAETPETPEDPGTPGEPSDPVVEFSGGLTQSFDKTCSISMTASPVEQFTNGTEYYFECITDETKSSGWIENSTYTCSNLDINTTYSFRIKARDRENPEIETEWSETLSAATAAWNSQDIGDVEIEGSLSYDPLSGIFALTGSGEEILEENDELHFAYQNISGDVTIIAGIKEFIDAPKPWTMAGVMIRDSASSDSNFIHVLMTRGNKSRCQVRNKAEDEDAEDCGKVYEEPTGWVKIVRSGNNFEAFVSADNNGSPESWESIASITIPMSEDVLVGLAVSSNQDDEIFTAEFYDVQVIQ